MADMSKVVGFCNLYNSPKIGGLNDNRALGSVTFTGRFALMDFALSNFSNSGIDRVCVLTNKHPQSVLTHIEGGEPWIRNTKTGFVYLFYNEVNVDKPKFNTALANIEANRMVLSNESFEYAVIAPSNFIMCMDFKPIVEAHKESGCGITMVYAPIHDGKKLFLNADVLKVNGNGLIQEVSKNTKRKDEILSFLETFVISREVLDRMLELRKIDSTLDIKDIVYKMIKNGEKVNGFKFEHFVLPITNYHEYISSSFRMLKHESRRKLFRPNWPIYTTTHDTPPAKYGPKAEVSDSDISNGCIIKGRVEHSILSRSVVVEEGAVVKNCIIFSMTKIGKNAKLNGVITDKKVVISDGTVIKNDIESDPKVITQGTKI